MKIKAITIIIVMIVIICCIGCSKEIKNTEKYEEKAIKYLSEKYGDEFKIVDSYINNDGKKHIVILKDKNGVFVNVSANTENPYDFKDDYADALASYKLQDMVDTSFLEEHGQACLYVSLKEKDAKNINIDSKNIESCTLVVGIYSAPGDLVVRNLYDLYKELNTNTYNNTTMVAMFAENTDNFNNYINNFNICSEIGLTKDIKTLYKTVNITENNLNLENFKKLFKP